MATARILGQLVVAAILVASCSSVGDNPVATGTPNSLSPSGSAALVAPRFDPAVDTVPVSSPEPTVPATGGAPRANPVGRIEGDLQLDGHVVVLGSDSEGPAGRIINLATDEVVAFAVEQTPARWSTPVSVDGVVLYASEGSILALDSRTVTTTVIVDADWVSPSSEPNRFWVARTLAGANAIGAAEWVEMDLSGQEFRTQSTTGSLDPEVSVDEFGSTLFVGVDLEPLQLDGMWPVGRLGSVVLFADCEPVPEVEPPCAVRGIEQATGAEVASPIAAEYVSTATNMDGFLVDPTGRYLLSSRYRNDYFAADVIDLDTGDALESADDIFDWCSARGSSWSSSAPPVVACGGTIIDVESAEYVRYGLGGRFGATLIVFTS